METCYSLEGIASLVLLLNINNILAEWLKFRKSKKLIFSTSNLLPKTSNTSNTRNSKLITDK